VIETGRLILRGWRADDAAAHHAMCNDPRVAAMIGRAPSKADSEAVVQRQNELLARLGYCFWALERRDSGEFIGWCGIKPGRAPIKGETEIGWSLAADQWGQGLAREAAEATLAWVWAHTDLAEIVAITTPGNARSWGLMERLGMRRCSEEDFEHPDLALGDPLRAHILYRIARPNGG
jgi:RimJ/RimL family protein N-acetyltransferase